MEIGNKLKEARESKNISLDRLQETTKIQKRYLLAIEQGELHILPGKFYARAFIKEYAIAVGLNPEELLEGYKDEVPTTENDHTLEYTRMQRSRKGSGSGKVQASFSFIPTVIVFLLVIGIIFIAWTLYQKDVSTNDSDPVDQNENDEIIRNSEKATDESDVEEDDENNSDTADTSENDGEDEMDKEDEETSESEFSLVEEGTGNSPESTYDFNDAGDEVIVTLESNEDTETYLEVTNGDGESFYASMFTPDQSPHELDLTGEEEIYFNIGNATALKININGTDFEYSIDPEDSVHQKVWININE